MKFVWILSHGSIESLQRPWRILPTVFVFSLAMGILSVYTSVVTQSGLNELCTKLGQVAGTNKCTYTINVVTLAYDRRIRGVYSATRLTIISAWLHTLCWIGSAVTVLLRIILVVDFRLVKVRVNLKGDIEKMLERHEKHIRTDEFINKNSPRKTSTTSVKVRFVNKGFGTDNFSQSSQEAIQFVSTFSPYSSENSLVPDEARKLTIRSTESKYLKENRFIVEMLHDIVDSIGVDKPTDKVHRIHKPRSEINLLRQRGQQKSIRSASSGSIVTLIDREEAEQLAKNFRRHLGRKKTIHNFELMTSSNITITPSSGTPMKSSLKNKSVQTEESTEDPLRVHNISSPSGTIHVLKAPDRHAWNQSLANSTVTTVSETRLLLGNRNLNDKVQVLDDKDTIAIPNVQFLYDEDTLAIPPPIPKVQFLYDEDTLPIHLLVDTSPPDIQQQPKIEETKNVAKKEHGILIRDDEKSGPSRADAEERQNDPNDKKGHSEKNKKKEKQD